MYNDFRSTKRESWAYTYTGAELLPFARINHRHYYAAEKAAREALTALMSSMDVTANDERVTRAREAIEKNGNLREQCAVFVHEFGRNSGREYMLSLGDVVFFGLFEEESPD